MNWSQHNQLWNKGSTNMKKKNEIFEKKKNSPEIKDMWESPVFFFYVYFFVWFMRQNIHKRSWMYVLWHWICELCWFEKRESVGRHEKKRKKMIEYYLSWWHYSKFFLFFSLLLSGKKTFYSVMLSCCEIYVVLCGTCHGNFGLEFH